jgi:hypothetical protein
MFHMDRKAFERWRETRKKGRARFIWVHGVIGFGLCMTMGMELWLYFYSKGMHPHLWELAALVPFLCLGGGYVWGVWVWNMGESMYQSSPFLHQPNLSMLDRHDPGKRYATADPAPPEPRIRPDQSAVSEARPPDHTQRSQPGDD